VNSNGIGAGETITGGGLDATRIGEEEREAPAVTGNQILGGADADVRWSCTGVADKQSYNPRMPAQHFAKHFSEHQKVIEACIASLQPASDAAGAALLSCIGTGGKILAFGNGGSATQASHLVEELIGRFKATRRALPAISLVGDSGVVTCIANDFGYGALFERQVEALTQRGDVVVGITTSGRSENVLRGLKAAKEKGAITIALCGRQGLQGGTADHVVAVPSNEGAYIQEVHLMLLHVWCIAIDAAIAEGAL
jgi:D-sedoheptulose 7-phosphate isomerase